MSGDNNAGNVVCVRCHFFDCGRVQYESEKARVQCESERAFKKVLPPNCGSITLPAWGLVETPRVDAWGVVETPRVESSLSYDIVIGFEEAMTTDQVSVWFKTALKDLGADPENSVLKDCSAEQGLVKVFLIKQEELIQQLGRNHETVGSFDDVRTARAVQSALEGHEQLDRRQSTKAEAPPSSM